MPRIRGINIILLTKSSSEIRTSAFNSLFFFAENLGLYSNHGPVGDKIVILTIQLHISGN